MTTFSHFTKGKAGAESCDTNRASSSRKWAGRCQSSLSSNQFYPNYQHTWNQHHHYRHHCHQPSTQPPSSIHAAPGKCLYAVSHSTLTTSLWSWHVFQMRRWDRNQAACPTLNRKQGRWEGTQACLLQNPTLWVHGSSLAAIHYADHQQT